MHWASHEVRWCLGVAQCPQAPVAAVEGWVLQPVRKPQELSILGWMAVCTSAVQLPNLSISAASEMGMALPQCGQAPGNKVAVCAWGGCAERESGAPQGITGQNQRIVWVERDP